MKNQYDISHLRASLEKFHKIPDHEWEKIEALASYATVKKGTVWVGPGDTAKFLGFVTQGVFRKYFTLDNGKEFTKGFTTEGQLVAPYVSLLTGNASELAIDALEDVTLITIEYNKLIEAYDRDLCWQIIGRKVAESLFIERERREYELLMLSAKERLLSFEREYPGLVNRIPQYAIASYIGITPVALSRMKKESYE